MEKGIRIRRLAIAIGLGKRRRVRREENRK
jgi:hypothetical protein